MKNQSHVLIRNTILAIFSLLLLYVATPAIAAPARVAVLPFDINAEKDMTFLREGILDMLGSRLAWPDKVKVISENETKAALASVEGFDGESRALLVGGGVGIPPMVFLAERLAADTATPWQPLVLMGSEVPFPFDLVDAGSHFHLPSAASSALSEMEALGVPSRLASRAGLAGCYRFFVVVEQPERVTVATAAEPAAARLAPGGLHGGRQLGVAGLEGGNGIGDMNVRNVFGDVDVVVNAHELLDVPAHVLQALGNLRPDGGKITAGRCVGDRVFAGLPGHLRSRRDREHRLHGKHVIEARR